MTANTPLEITLNTPIEVPAHQTYSLYVSTDASIYYNNGTEFGNTVASQRFMTIREGYGVPNDPEKIAGNFYGNLHNRAFCGTIKYELNDEISFGCVSEQKTPVEVAVILPPTVVDTILGDTVICLGNSVTLTAQGGFLGDNGTYEWFSDNCGGDFFGNTAQITITPEQKTTYFVPRKNMVFDP